MTHEFVEFWILVLLAVLSIVCVVLFLPTLGHSWHWFGRCVGFFEEAHPVNKRD